MLGPVPALWAGQDNVASHGAARVERSPLSEAQRLERIRELDPDFQGDLAPQAIGWLGDRFTGRTAPSDCGRIPAGNSLAPEQPVPAS